MIWVGRVTSGHYFRDVRGEDGSYYRIRTGTNRVGLIIDGDTVTFVRALHRSEIHRYFQSAVASGSAGELFIGLSWPVTDSLIFTKKKYF